MKEITIAGGGLCGLSLAIGLSRRGVPVVVHEAGSYPRHRVCGEFICGVSEEVLKRLGIWDLFSKSPSYGRSVWFSGDEEISRHDLPQEAWGISRYVMDEWMRETLEGSGGEVVSGSRLKREAREGLVWTAGRRPEKSEWLGLKTHVRGYELAEPLEMHLGEGGYAGLVEVESGWVNVCGLFRKRTDIEGRGEELLPSYLKACGMVELAERVEQAEWRAGAFSAVAGFQLGQQNNDDGVFVLGDAESMIPPFTGNGMSMAFEAADLALEPLLAYASGEMAWDECQSLVTTRLKKHFSKRLKVAGACHLLLLDNRGQFAIRGLAKTGLLPFRTLFSLSR